MIVASRPRDITPVRVLREREPRTRGPRAWRARRRASSRRSKPALGQLRG
jgi:hypothetical protein